LLTRIRAENGADVAQGMFAVTVVKRRLVCSYLFAPHVGAQLVTEQLEQLRRNVGALRVANGK